MKKVINGKTYNTETAEHLGEYINIMDSTNLEHFEENLYKKKNGEFFLLVKGGQLSKYAEYDKEGYFILTITVGEAKSWVEEHLDAEDYIEIFGEVEE